MYLIISSPRNKEGKKCITIIIKVGQAGLFIDQNIILTALIKSRSVD